MLKQCICDSTEKLAGGVQTEKQEGPQVPQQSVPDTPKELNEDTIDLEDVTDTRYKVVDVDISGIPSRIHLVRPEESGDRPTVPYIEKCFYCVTFLKNGEPKAILVKVDDAHGSYKDKTGCRGKPGWSNTSTYNYTKKLETLKINTDPPKKFTLDISSLKEDERFKLVKEDRDGIATLYYSSQPGHLIEKIVDGDLEVWTASDNQVCYFCELHSKGDSKLLRMHAEKGYAIIFGWYEKSRGKWNVIREKEFYKKLEMSEVTAIT
ncbi:hypothetical protein BEWA_050720 [Theileria equi strain WA]|uniref:Signal peptide containing protein n=1 Tax=Theileria equi strain WA TaxID=1537102 RepID=L1LBF4_THEEQ|nr:hypothetical protein BEWA_050720 [Theileria equi strain WA]EKX72604.1 hypothetical protein BEWA_050720 [Theileria equi strain WA]|eukprot:XP_004832056.1 hypothetical protein BEWA_050720 [Theileria equi strain WA]